MAFNYTLMKARAGVAENLFEEGDALKLDDTFSQLRPDSPFKLSDMLSPAFDPKKSLQTLISQGRPVPPPMKELAELRPAPIVRRMCMYTPEKVASEHRARAKKRRETSLNTTVCEPSRGTVQRHRSHLSGSIPERFVVNG